MRKMITEAYCNKCEEVFIPDEEYTDDLGRIEHFDCQGFDTKILGSWYGE